MALNKNSFKRPALCKTCLLAFAIAPAAFKEVIKHTQLLASFGAESFGGIYA